MAQGRGVQVKTRIYLEGRLLENGFLSVRVDGGVGRPATAQLELVPTTTIKHIMAGTWVHVFATDPWDLNPVGDLSDFKLLFEGVVISRGFVRKEAGRNFVVQCADPSIYWTKAKQFWLNIGSANGNIVDQLAIQTSGGYGRFGQTSTTGTYGYMASKLAFANKEQAEERFMDTLISVIDDLGNVNPFYTNARNRFRLTDRIIRGPAGKTDELFQLSFLGDFLEGLAGRVSGQTDLVEVVNQLLGAIFHEWVSIPAPPYVKAKIFDRDVFGNIKRNKKTVRNAGPRGRTNVNVYDFETAIDTVIGSCFFKPDIYTLSPPTCNVLFPNMYQGASYNENLMQEVTRLSMKPQLPLVSAGVTQGLLLRRPVELEVFTALVQDPQRRTPKTRTPDGQFADGAGQTPTFTDYDWTTNEERIRGIVYDFMNLAPAPSTLTLSDPGKKTPTGARSGGVPKYLQNVASYEWFKAKLQARAASIEGVFNMRPVPGFPLLVLDDSEAGLNMIAQLDSIQHVIEATGVAMTSYGIQYARLADEVDYNQPKFKGGLNAEGLLDFDLFRDANGQYDFSQLFHDKLQPPIPEWFDASYRNVVDLDLRYREWFGNGAGVVQNVLFKNPGKAPVEAAIKAASDAFGTTESVFSSVGAAIATYGERAPEFEAILEANENIPLTDAIAELNKRYLVARQQGNEFDLASRFTDRSFAKIDEAFRFIGAAPLELADRVPATATAAQKSLGPQFTKNPASSRKIDYRTMRLDFFVGDPSAGAGYAAVPEGSTTAAPTQSTTTTTGGLVPDAVSGADAAAPVDRMSGAFPVFDTKIHTGKEATDAKTRSALLSSGGERAVSDRARYDGRPLMFDFEFRLWQQSLADAGLTPTSEAIAENAEVADYFVQDPKGNIVRPKTAVEQAAAVKARQENLAAKNARGAVQAAAKRKDPTSTKNTSMSSRDQAPTGAGLEEEKRHPLPQPLSEKQVVDLRRAIIDAYREELARTRGFTG